MAGKIGKTESNDMHPRLQVETVPALHVRRFDLLFEKFELPYTGHRDFVLVCD